MTKYVALLRGINVGGNNKVAMVDLKKCFEALGFKNVLTYINSGNVIFETTSKDTSDLTNKIEREIKKTFGFEVKVVIRDRRNIMKLSKAVPADWLNDSEQKTDVMFLWEEFDSKESLKLIKINPEVDRLMYIKGAIVWNIFKKDYNLSGMNKYIGTPIYKGATARNINTLRKLATLM